MTFTLFPTGADFGPDGRLGQFVAAYGITGDGRELVVQRRMFNATITIGPRGSHEYDDHW